MISSAGETSADVSRGWLAVILIVLQLFVFLQANSYQVKIKDTHAFFGIAES